MMKMKMMVMADLLSSFHALALNTRCENFLGGYNLLSASVSGVCSVGLWEDDVLSIIQRA